MLFAADPTAATHGRYVVAVGLGSTSPLGSIATSGAFSNAYDVAIADRPWNLRGGSNFVVANSGASTLMTFDAAGGATTPTLSLPGNITTTGTASTMLGIYNDPAPQFGAVAVPVALLGCSTGTNANHHLPVGLPIAAPGTSLTFQDTNPYVPFAGNSPFVWTSFNAAPPLFGARMPVFNITTHNSTTPPAAVFASPGSGTTGRPTHLIEFNLDPVTTPSFHAANVIASEILAL